MKRLAYLPAAPVTSGPCASPGHRVRIIFPDPQSSILRNAQLIYRLGADLVLIFHLAFVGFVVLGALLVLRWPRLMPVHVAAVAWGVLIEFTGFLCPLTPLEITLRQRGGEAGYAGDFIEHYILAVLYPAGLTRHIQFWLGFAALVPNVLAYTYLLLRWRRRRAQQCARQ